MTDKHIEQILMKLQEQLQATQAELQATNTKLEKVQKQHTSTLRRMKVEAGLGLCALIGALWFTPLPQVMAQGYGQTLKQLIADVAALKTKTQYISADSSGMIIQDPAGATVDIHGTDVKVISANMWVQNGLGATSGNPNDPADLNNDAVTNGLGNLIIGYNETSGQSLQRTGSHNLIVGVANDYRSFGGIVVGSFSMITAPFASVSGGRICTASGYCSSVSGGFVNTALGLFSSVSGGEFNTASGDFSSVSGGYNNTENNGDGWAGGSYHTP